MDDEALDLELETMWRSGSAVNSAKESSSQTAKLGQGEQNATLTFDFPEWGLDFYRGDSKRPKLRHFNSGNVLLREHRDPKRVSVAVAAPVNGCPILTLPDSIYVYILQMLETPQDLCSSRQVCRKWYSLCSQDSLWEKLGDYKYANLPRWLLVKKNVLACQVRDRFTYSRKSYDLLKEALDSWWNFGQPNGLYISSKICPLIRRMTLSDWCLMYDVMASAFMERSDELAGWLLFEKMKNNSFKQEGTSSGAGDLGMQLWHSLRNLWSHYVAWIKLVSLHCADLNYAIHRCMDTPTLYNKAIVSFRSQVLLSYELRGVLQEGLCFLSKLESEGTASEQDIELLCSLHHLLQELDVADDSTLPYESHTQMKLRRCFLGGESSLQHSRSQILAARLDTV